MGCASPWLRGALASGVAVVLAAGHATACRAPTQITIELFTDVRCSELRGTSITVGTLGDIESREPEAMTAACDESGRIGSLVIVPRGEQDSEIALRIVSAFDVDLGQCIAPSYGPGCIVARRALRFLPQASLYIPIRLTAVCKGIPCGATETCTGGSCGSATIPDPAACESAAGCGEDVLAKPPPPPPDAGPDVGPDTSPPVNCATDQCAVVAPPDWQLVAFGPRSAACPSGSATRDVVRDPVAAPGACACASCAIAPLTCTTNVPLQTVQDDMNNCGTNTLLIQSNGGACVAFGGSLLATTGVRPVRFPAHACTSGGVGVPAAAATPARLCTPDPACGGAACQGLPAGMRTCISRAGDVACPAGFAKTLVGDSVAVACPACACKVDVACPGTLTFYDNTACTLNPIVINANGVCISAPGPVAAYQWKPGVPQLTNCVATPQAATSVTPVGPRTVCCK